MNENARPLHVIASDIRANWPNMPENARAYANPMAALDKITDAYYADSAQSVVLYFLSNATTWRGPEARRVKDELKAMLKANSYKM